jgi:competence protein ComEC
MRIPRPVSYGQLQAALADAQVMTVVSGYSLEVSDGVRLEVLNPPEQPGLDDSLDDNGLVLRLSYGEASFLLTGDLGIQGQRLLLEDGQWPLARVLQLPQHGTVRSLDNAFLAEVQPQVVILQSDQANRRGDPDADTLAKLGDTPVFRTDQGGTIHIWTDGTQLWVEQTGKIR